MLLRKQLKPSDAVLLRAADLARGVQDSRTAGDSGAEHLELCIQLLDMAQFSISKGFVLMPAVVCCPGAAPVLWIVWERCPIRSHSSIE